MKRSRINLLAASLPCLLALSITAYAQARTTARKPAPHTAAKAAAAKPSAKSEACEALPTLSATIPSTTGCPVTLYALRTLDTTVGTGDTVSPRKWLTVAYTGYLQDGTKFDSSIGKDPITFPYGAHQVIAGWDTGFEGMHIGGKRRLYIPYELAYGEAGRPPVIPAKAMLVFDVELIAISDNPPAPKTPPTPPPPATPPATPAGTAKPADPAKPAEPAKPEPGKAPITDPTKPTTVPATPPKQ